MNKGLSTYSVLHEKFLRHKRNLEYLTLKQFDIFY